MSETGGDYMINETVLKNQLSGFQKAVKKLGDTVNKSGVKWNDAQFSRLSSSIKTVASSFKQVSIIGSQCCSAIKHFNAIENEK